MFLKIVIYGIFMLFAGQAASGILLGDNGHVVDKSSVREVYVNGSTTIFECPLPQDFNPLKSTFDQALLLSRSDFEWITKTFVKKRPFSVVSQAKRRFLKIFLLAIKKRESGIYFFSCPHSSSKSFIIELVFDVKDSGKNSNPESRKMDDKVFIYGPNSDEILEFVKTCVVQRGWFRLNKFASSAFILAPFFFIAFRLFVARKEQDSVSDDVQCVICWCDVVTDPVGAPCACVNAVWCRRCDPSNRDRLKQCPMCRTEFSHVVPGGPKKRFERIPKKECIPNKKQGFSKKEIFEPWIIGWILAIALAHVADSYQD